jgi:NADH-quinone oxidoreductase subunit G
VAKIFINGRAYEFSDTGRCLLDVCLSLGFDIPYFCWHPAMQSVGACRQCAVKVFKDEDDTQGKIVMSCMTQAREGLRVTTDSPDVLAFRARIIELLMLNHPHDCPICDEGGECHLQDMTVMTGWVYRRTRFPKRTHRNQNLGPLVNHEMNRCIQCYRCVRFYRDYAGGRDLDVLGWHDDVYFGRFADGQLESPFSGNLVEVCPTGVFTDKTFKQHYVRKWDLQTAPSVCVHCSLGCNTIPGEYAGLLRVIKSRFNADINGYFLCDRGRYGYEFVNATDRPRDVLRRIGLGEQSIVKPAEAIDALAELLRTTKAIGLGSPRASLEANYALRKLVGAENFYAAMASDELSLLGRVAEILRTGPAPSASLQDVRLADAALVLGEDTHATAPMLALALRLGTFNEPVAEALRQNIPRWHANAINTFIQDRRGPLFIATPTATKLDADATQAWRAKAGDIATLGFAVAHAIDASAAMPADVPDEIQQMAATIAEALLRADRPIVVAGTSCRSRAVLDAAGNVAWALRAKGRPAKLCFAVPDCNSLALPLLGAGDIADACQAVETGQAQTVIVLEADLQRCLSSDHAGTLMNQAKHLIVLDCLATETVRTAEWVLPSASFAEASGTLINNEGRAQRFFQVFVPGGEIRSSWRWLADIQANRDPGMKACGNLDDILAAMAEDIPALAGALSAAPLAGYRQAGMKIPRQTHRHSGRTAIRAPQQMHEPRPADDPDSPLAFSMEGYPLMPESTALIDRYWSAGWNSNQAINKFQIEVGGELRGGPAGSRLIEPDGNSLAKYAAPEVKPTSASRQEGDIS